MCPAVSRAVCDVEQIDLGDGARHVHAGFKIHADARDHLSTSRKRAVRACAMKSGTKHSTLPPSRATSRTMELFKYVYRSYGMRNTVAMLSAS